MLWGEVNAEKICATESDVLSKKSKNEKSSHWMRPPSVGNPRKGSQTPVTAPKPINTDKHAPPSLLTSPPSAVWRQLAWRAYIYLYVYLFVRTSRTPRGATMAL